METEIWDIFPRVMPSSADAKSRAYACSPSTPAWPTPALRHQGARAPIEPVRVRSGRQIEPGTGLRRDRRSCCRPDAWGRLSPNVEMSRLRRLMRRLPPDAIPLSAGRASHAAADLRAQPRTPLANTEFRVIVRRGQNKCAPCADAGLVRGGLWRTDGRPSDRVSDFADVPFPRSTVRGPVISGASTFPTEMYYPRSVCPST
jgi:hypothetical protein